MGSTVAPLYLIMKFMVTLPLSVGQIEEGTVTTFMPSMVPLKPFSTASLLIWPPPMTTSASLNLTKVSSGMKR